MQPAPTAAASFLKSRLVQDPALRQAYIDHCERTGEPTEPGVPVRVRYAHRYSTVFVTYDAAGAPTVQGTRLYAAALGDTVAGFATPLTIRFTNVRQSGKLDNEQAFIALGHGFRVVYVTPPASAEAQAIIRNNLLDQVAATLDTGTETSNIWGPLSIMALGESAAVGVLGDLGAGAQLSALGGSFVGSRFQKLAPPQVFHPGSGMGVELTFPNTLPTDVRFANAVVGIQHVMAGYTKTVVDG